MASSAKRGSAFLYVIVLMVGVALGFCTGVTRSAGNDEAKPAEKEKAAKRPLTDVGEASSVKALRARIAELERQLAAKAEGEAASEEAVASAGQQNNRPGRGNPREWLENLRKNDPERFTQMTNRFAQFRQHRLEHQQRRLDFLASIDTSQMSEEGKKTHVTLQDAIARREELEDKLYQLDNSDEERGELIGQIMEAERELRDLRRAERDNLFETTAKTLGFEGEDAKELVGTLKGIIESTEGQWGGPPPGGGPGRGRRRR